MNRYCVKEGLTGVLELTDDAGNVEIYRPDCDLDKAQALLYEFYNISTSRGMLIKDAFLEDNIDWFPTVVSMLYWQYFYQVVKYRSLLEEYLAGKVEFKSISPGKFKDLIQIMLAAEGKGPGSVKKIVRRTYGLILQLRNKIIPHTKGDLLFYRYGTDDFRTKEILEKLEKKYTVLQVTTVSYKVMANNFFNRSVYILPVFQPKNRYSMLSERDNIDVILKHAVYFVESLISTHRYNYVVNKQNFNRFQYQLFFGLDDANVIYPMIYAAQDLGIKTLGFQHGLYARRHEGYVMQGIEKYRWYDNVLVWGEYWKSNVLKNSSLYSEDYHIVCSNKHSYEYKCLPKKGKRKVILIPYEFLSDSIKVGEYIKQFMKAGFTILFKPRSDDRLDEQLRAYYLGDYEEKIEIIDEITPETLAEVDVIAGTMTTLLFDLAPYNKPIWILESCFRLMYDMVEDGFARLITESDMKRIDKIFEEEVGKKRNIDPLYFFDSAPLTEVVADYIHAGVSHR